MREVKEMMISIKLLKIHQTLPELGIGDLNTPNRKMREDSEEFWTLIATAANNWDTEGLERRVSKFSLYKNSNCSKAKSFCTDKVSSMSYPEIGNLRMSRTRIISFSLSI